MNSAFQKKNQIDEQFITFDSTRKCNIYNKRCISKPSNPTIASESVRHQTALPLRSPIFVHDPGKNVPRRMSMVLLF